MSDRLKDKVALITGGTSGIGEATVELFIQEGAYVVIAGRNALKGQAMVASLGPRAKFVRADVARESDIKAAVDQTVAAFGRLDCLFNNAGGPTRGSVETVTEADFAAAMNLLLGSVVFGVKHAAPVMKAQGGGRIINNASVAARHTHMGDYLYSMAKAAVIQATRMAGMELGPFGITVNAISPGAIATPIFFGGSTVSNALDPSEAERKLTKLTVGLAKATPLHRSGLPRDIATAALYLASDEGGFVNCQDIVVDGGMSAGGRVNYE